MTTLTINSSASDPNGQTVTEDMFGVNTLVSYEQLLDDPTLWDNIAEMGSQNLRYPGGSVTEQYFDITNPDASTGTHKGNVEPLIGLTDFMTLAGEAGATIDFVLPTRGCFTETAAEALENGTYGNRTVDMDYLENEVFDFVVDLIMQADALGVELGTIELGNEFWGEATMTASEYGALSAELAIIVQDAIDSVGTQDPAIVVQSLNAAGYWSPNGDKIAYVFEGEVYKNSPDPSAVEYTIDSVGSAASQNQTIISFFENNPAAAQALDGVSVHYYPSSGLDGADTSGNFAFSQVGAWGPALADVRGPDAPDLLDYVTEWNARLSGEDNVGLKQGQMLIEQVYEMATHGVDVAHVWPLLFDTVQSTSLTDYNGDDLAIGGTTFALMSESIIGLDASFDQEYPADGGGVAFDIHGFASDAQLVMFISERAGDAVDDVSLDDLSDFQDSHYFVTQTFLHDGGTTGGAPNAEPIITFSNGYVGLGSDIDVGEVLPYEIVRVEVTYVTETADTLQGRGGDDTIDGMGGADMMYGDDGDDTFVLSDGDDQAFGGNDDDTFEINMGHDATIEVTGGEGADHFIFFDIGPETSHTTHVTDFNWAEDSITYEGDSVSVPMLAGMADDAYITSDGDLVLRMSKDNYIIFDDLPLKSLPLFKDIVRFQDSKRPVDMAKDQYENELGRDISSKFMDFSSFKHGKGFEFDLLAISRDVEFDFG